MIGIKTAQAKMETLKKNQRSKERNCKKATASTPKEVVNQWVDAVSVFGAIKSGVESVLT